MENKLESPATGNTTSLEDSLQFLRTEQRRMEHQSKTRPCMQRRGLKHHIS